MCKKFKQAQSYIKIIHLKRIVSDFLPFRLNLIKDIHVALNVGNNIGILFNTNKKILIPAFMTFFREKKTKQISFVKSIIVQEKNSPPKNVYENLLLYVSATGNSPPVW